MSRLTRELHERLIATTKGPARLVRALEMARSPPDVFEYMLEKKAEYHVLVEKLKGKRR